jgi:hypothetical protein
MARFSQTKLSRLIFYTFTTFTHMIIWQRCFNSTGYISPNEMGKIIIKGNCMRKWKLEADVVYLNLLSRHLSERVKENHENNQWGWLVSSPWIESRGAPNMKECS